MSTSKDDSKKSSGISKEKKLSRTSLPKKETITDRTDTKKKQEPQKTKSKETTGSLSKTFEENVKPKKSSISVKTSSKSENAPSTSTTKRSSKSEKEPSTPSRRVSSKREKIPATTSTTVSSRSEKMPSNTTSKTASRSNKDITMSKSIAASLKTNSNHEVSSTPSSNRVTKTQYFPSKNLYTNALKYADVPENILEDVKKSVKKDEKISKKSSGNKVKNSSSKGFQPNSIDSHRSVKSIKSNLKESSFKTFSPDTGRKRSAKEEIKDTITRESSPDPSSISERPKTATLRKGSIVNENIVGPEAPKYNKKDLIKKQLSVEATPLPVKEKSPTPSNSEDNYEDDFESYESDFETYSSSEDNKNLAKISGEETSSVSSNSDVPEQTNLSPTILQTDNKKISSITIDDERTHDSGTFELSDFKHKQILDYIKESVEKDNLSVLQEFKLKEKANMSSLSDEGFEDQQSLQFINFADAKKKFERRRASEQRKKRGEEILGMIKLDTVNFTIFDSPSIPYEDFISSYGKNNTVQVSTQSGDDNMSEEVQTEPIKVQMKWTQVPIKFSSFDQSQESFWSNYKKEYLGVGDHLPVVSFEKYEHVNEKRLRSFLNQSVDLILDIMAEANIKNLDKLNKNERDLPFSDGYLQFNTEKDVFENTKVQNISIFSMNINHILTIHVKNDNFDFIKSLVSVWDISNFDAPQTILVSCGEVWCATFYSDAPEYIFAGQRDGAILVWDIKEKIKVHDIQSRTPLFTTHIGSSHFAKVVAIQQIKNLQEHKGYFDVTENNELCSLDEDGEIIIWSFYTDPEFDSESKKSTSNVVLMNTGSISLQNIFPEMPDLLCTDFLLLEKEIYIATNYGYILHCLLNVNGRRIKKFVPATTIDATCLEACPFSPSFFLAGCADGNITLYSKSTERPLMVLRNNEEITNTSVQIIQWSKTKPFVLYAKDSRNTIHIWDLSKSDMYPEYSIPFKENISCLKLSHIINIELEETSYMVIGTDAGKVYLHLLNKEYGQAPHEMYKEHVATFLNYVSRL